MAGEWHNGWFIGNGEREWDVSQTKFAGAGASSNVGLFWWFDVGGARCGGPVAAQMELSVESHLKWRSSVEGLSMVCDGWRC